MKSQTTQKVTVVENIKDATIQGMKHGFKEGYQAAMLALEAFAEGATDPEARKYMTIARAALEKMASRAFEVYDTEIVATTDIPSSGSVQEA